MISDTEHHFTCLWVIYVFFRKMSIQVFCPYSHVTPLIRYIICKYLLTCIRLAFLFVDGMVSFAVQRLFNLMYCHLLIFPFVALASRDRSRKILQRPISKSKLCMFSPSFIDSGLILKCLIHFEFIFVYDVGKWSSFILLCSCPVFRTIY